MNAAKILVIDDEPALQRAMQKVLKTENYSVVIAGNGIEGYEHFKKEKPDLVLLDLRMPKMDGFGFLEKIRIREDDPYSVVVITGHGNDREVERCFELGVNFFLHKPISLVEVRCITKRCLEMKATEKELREHRSLLEKKVAERTRELTDQLYFQQNLIDSIPIPVYFKDPDLKYLGCNKASEETLGYAKEHIIGRTVHDIMPENIARIHHQKDLQLLQAGEMKHYEVSTEYSNGKKHDQLVFKALFNNKKGDVEGLIGTNLDITERNRARLKLEHQAEELKNANTALRVILKQVNENKTDMESKVLDNFARLVSPYLETLEINLAGSTQLEYIKIIQENIKKITSSFSQKLSSSYLGLSPREIQVADLVRHGRTNKESSGILNISVNAVEFHRNNLRRKLGIQNKKVNLRTYLLSMD
ncbi:MAG: response regulator [Deltaproteobacteria bacterium]|jgi:PAS domain S-box-containing protein|nr:response regulator [Deltaproteobacteria bacterium]